MLCGPRFHRFGNGPLPLTLTVFEPALGRRPTLWGFRRVVTTTNVRARAVAPGLALVGALMLAQLALGSGDLSPVKRMRDIARPPAAVSPAGAADAAAAIGTTVVEGAVALPPVPATIHAATTLPAPGPPPAPLFVPTDPAEWFNPRGAHGGTEGVIVDLAKLGVGHNAPLYVNECWGRTWGAATSDHHVSQSRSWACDLSIAGIQVPTPQADEAARRIASALGVPDWTGGNIVKHINGYRIQVLWRVAGHFNHVHIGARKV